MYNYHMDSNNSEQNKTEIPAVQKKPLSITFIVIYSFTFVLAILLNGLFTIDFIDFLYGVLVIILFSSIPLIVIFFTLLFINLKRNKRRAKWFSIGVGICLILILATFILGGLFKDQILRAQDYSNEKNYELAIKYYDFVIKREEDQDKVKIALSGKEESQKFIGESKKHEKNGDIYFENELYQRALEEYVKAYEVFPYLEGIGKKINKTNKLKEKNGSGAEDASSFVLLNKNLKFKYLAGLPVYWGSTKISEPVLGQFQDIKIEEGRFFESDNELRISGNLYGDKIIDQYIESTEGLFVFISAAIIDDFGNVKWSMDGYLKGNTPYLRSMETKEFSLTGPVNIPVEKGDRLFIAAYLNREVLLIINNEDSEIPDANKNIFALYSLIAPF